MNTQMYGTMSVLPEELITRIFQLSMPLDKIKRTHDDGCATCDTECDPFKQFNHVEYKQFLEGRDDREQLPKELICQCTHCAECLYTGFKTYGNVQCPTCEKYKSWSMMEVARRIFF